MTTPEPGERLVFTYPGTVRPFSIAFRATNPAPSMTDGLLHKRNLKRMSVTQQKQIRNGVETSGKNGIGPVKDFRQITISSHLVLVHEVIAAMTTEP